MSQQCSEEFFAEMKEWSERKLDLLENYLKSFVRILGRTNYYVDGFAGRGTYGETKTKGSPLRAAEMAQELKSLGKPYSLRCINVEVDLDHFADLQKATDCFGDLVLNLPGTFTENLDRILREVAGSPGIFFLDPFGVNHNDWHAVQRIIARREPTDLWIRFDHKTVLRLTGFYPPETPEAFSMLDILTRLYGVEDVKEVLQRIDASTAEDRTRNTVALYLGRLAAEFTRSKGSGFAAAYSIRAITGENKYFLVFAASSPKAIALASDVVYHREEEYQREADEFRALQDRQLTLFSIKPSDDDVFEAKVKELKEDVFRQCRGTTAERLNVHVSILEKWFGRISKRHLTAALRALKEEGKLTVVNGTIGDEKCLLEFQASN